MEPPLTTSLCYPSLPCSLRPIQQMPLIEGVVILEGEKIVETVVLEQFLKEPDQFLMLRHAWRSVHNRNKGFVNKKVVTDVSKFLASSKDEVLEDDILFGCGTGNNFVILEEQNRLEFKDVRFIGICGIGGIGKTAWARWLYNSLSPQFELKSFLANVAKQTNEHNLVLPFQKQLLSETLRDEHIPNLWNEHNGAEMIQKIMCDKKCLIVIDDVDDDDQLSYLAKSPQWFGPGSTIIITSRNKDLLTRCGVENKCMYELRALTELEALCLLSVKAFGRNKPPQDLLELCTCIVKHTGGLPLALELFASILKGRPSHECMLLMHHVRDMGSRIVEDISSGPGKGSKFWREKLAGLLLPGIQHAMDLNNSAHNDRTWKINVDAELIIILISLSVEFASTILDQLSSEEKLFYAVIAEILSIVGLIFSILEFAYKAQKEKVIWKRMNNRRIPWLYYRSPRDNVPFGSFPDILGLICALFQCVTVTINFTFVVDQAGSPIKITVWPTVFAFMVLFSKLLDARKCKMA